MINAKNCPCHRPGLKLTVEMDIVMHLAVWVSQDWNKCQGTPTSDLFRRAPLPHTAFRCRIRTACHFPMLEHTARTTDLTALRRTYVYIMFLHS